MEIHLNFLSNFFDEKGIGNSIISNIFSSYSSLSRNFNNSWNLLKRSLFRFLFYLVGCPQHWSVGPLVGPSVGWSDDWSICRSVHPSVQDVIELVRDYVNHVN